MEGKLKKMVAGLKANMGKRIPGPILWVIGSIALLFCIVGIFLTVIQWVTFQRAYYVKEYDKLDIAHYTGMDERDLMAATDALLDYIKGKSDNLDIEAEIHGHRRPVFNQKEKDHMVDVRDLFILNNRLKWLLLGGFILLTVAIYYIEGRNILRYYSLIYLVILALLGILALTVYILMLKDFTLLWHRFHELFFKNDLWLLDPETDILVQMVPERFFFNTITRILSLFSRFMVGLGAISSIILIRWRKVQ